ncbi:MAG: hypothetical protein H0W12_01265 [Chitinophagaceae bacterium]|nr:hypothetical protein [Chitinophagaceae bacterium]
MEKFYKAYSKPVGNRKYYFVKSYIRFPEYKNVDDLLMGYAMHINFNRACDIAGINNMHVRQRLLEQIETAPETRLVNIFRPVKPSHNFIRSLRNSFSLLNARSLSRFWKTAG